MNTHIPQVGRNNSDFGLFSVSAVTHVIKVVQPCARPGYIDPSSGRVLQLSQYLHVSDRMSRLPLISINTNFYSTSTTPPNSSPSPAPQRHVPNPTAYPY